VKLELHAAQTVQAVSGIPPFEMIARSTSDAMLVMKLDGTITFWNDSAARMYGYDPAEAVGRHVSMLVPPGDEQEAGQLLSRLRRGERIEHSSALRAASDGGLLDVDVLLWPIPGTRELACAVARDTSELTRARREITRLYEHQSQVALTLRQALTQSPPPVPGMATASRCFPATPGAGVGGYWFDLVPLGAGRVGVIIGDVMGRGLEAAAVMGRLRPAAGALARTGMSPRQFMHALDMVASDIPEQLTTCCYLIIDSRAGEVTGCSAGHLPVLRVSPDGVTRQLPLPVGVPLGVGGHPHEQATVPAGDGTLVLYTDGLIETRAADIEEQIAALQRALSAIFAGQPTLEDAADQVLAAMLPRAEDPPDDVTLLLAGIPLGSRAPA
jgi:PAS domain S-box-containing protein